MDRDLTKFQDCDFLHAQNTAGKIVKKSHSNIVHVYPELSIGFVSVLV